MKYEDCIDIMKDNGMRSILFFIILYIYIYCQEL